MDAIFSTLFSKVFFIVGEQLLITCIMTNFAFSIFKCADPKIGEDGVMLSNIQILRECNPQYRWLFSQGFFLALLMSDMIVFLVLLFWGIHQSLFIAFTLFSLWSLLTGLEIEYVLIQVDHGLGRKVLALTACAVFATALIGVYSGINFGFLQIPLFIALSGLVLIGIVRVLGGMKTVNQRIISGLGVVIFTLYLVFDFNRLLQRQNAGDNGWETAMSISIKIYLDIINLFLHLLSAMSKHHH